MASTCFTCGRCLFFSFFFRLVPEVEGQDVTKLSVAWVPVDIILQQLESVCTEDLTEVNTGV